MLFVLGLEAKASNYDQANWYATLDVQQLRSKIVPLIAGNKGSNIQNKLDEHLPKEVHQFTLYGHSENDEDVSVVVSGDFGQFQVNEYINSLMLLADPKEAVEFSQFDNNQYGGQTLEHYQVSSGGKTVSFYSAKLSEDLIVISMQEQEVKNWLDNRYSGYDLKNSGMVSLLVNIESAMAHMGADLGSNKHTFNSAVFNKITQFSASIFEAGGNLNIETALSTADEATAKQLEQVINGLVAMNALSNLDQENELLSAAMTGLDIRNQGNDLLASTEFALSLIAEIDVDID